MMGSAASRLDLPDYAPMMHYSASSLELPEYVPMLAQILRDLDLANQVPRLRDTANDLADTTRTLSQWVTQIKAAAQIAAPVFPEHVDIRRKSPFLVRAALIGCLGWLLIGLLIYLHVKGHF
jgi:cell division protein FtsX